MVGCSDGCVVGIVDDDALQKIVEIDLFSLAQIKTVAIVGSFRNLRHSDRIVEISFLDNEDSSHHLHQCAWIIGFVIIVPKQNLLGVAIDDGIACRANFRQILCQNIGGRCIRRKSQAQCQDHERR